MKLNLTLLLSAILLTTASGCASQRHAEHKVEKEIKAVVIEKNVTLSETARDSIMKSDKFTDIQKSKLLDLQAKTQAENAILKEDIEKAKIVLIQTALEPKMNKREYSILKKRITTLERKKVENGFKAITEARNIIDPKMTVENRELVKAFMFNHLQE